jgi:hypothetical protein
MQGNDRFSQRLGFVIAHLKKQLHVLRIGEEDIMRKISISKHAIGSGYRLSPISWQAAQ